MMKLIGCIVFLLGTFGMGIHQSFEYDEHTKYLSKAARMLEYLTAQLENENATLPECICRVSCRFEGILGKLLQSTTEKLDHNEGKPLYKVWQEEILILEDRYAKEDFDSLFHLFDQTGFYDTKTQKNRIEECKVNFQKKIENRNNEKNNKCRLYQSLGLLMGLFVIILLW